MISSSRPVIRGLVLCGVGMIRATEPVDMDAFVFMWEEAIFCTAW